MNQKKAKELRKAIKHAEEFRPLLTDLRWAAHNPNAIGAEPGRVMTSQFRGWEFGCKVEDLGTCMRRKVFVKAEQPFREIPREQKDPVMHVVMDEMLDQGTPGTSVEAIAPDLVMIVQDFVPILLQKKQTAKTHIKIDDGALLETGRIFHKG